MKKILVSAAIGALFIGAVWFSYAVNVVGLDRLDWPTVESTAYFVKSSGRDARVYEFESQLDPGKLCVAMITEAGGPVGLDCDPPTGR